MQTTPLSSIRIILVETSHPGNIGACARAMKTMGLTDLYLVKPKRFPDAEAVALSAGAEDILDNATLVSSLPEALSGCHTVFVTSARARRLSLPGMTPAEAGQFVAASPKQEKVAFVFGREQSGLSNQELLLGQYHIHIPTNSAYSSLNLSQAVQIVAYELRMQSLASAEAKVAMQASPLATHDAMEQFYAHLKEVLEAVEFLNVNAPRKLMERMRRLFGRIKLEESEVNLLRGMLKRIKMHTRSKDER